MSNSVKNSTPSNLTDWLRPHLRWVTVPSWLLSGVFHGVLASLIIFLAQLPSCRTDIAGDDGDAYRTVGIHVRTPDNSSEAEESPEATENTDVAYEKPFEIEDPVPDMTPPVALELPQTEIAPPRIGVGSVPVPNSVGVNDLLQPNQSANSASPSRPPSAVPGGTSFMGLKDVGKTFVYVIDRSQSMASDNAFAAAKAELLASVAHLDKNQQFQIIFYDTNVEVLKPRNGRFDMFWGTDAQRMQVSGRLSAIGIGGGTNHLPAITRALEFRPDVIYLLTDGDAEQALSAAELAEIKRMSRGTRINCIEFGRSFEPAIKGEANFLRKLSSDSRGKYIYINVKR